MNALRAFWVRWLERELDRLVVRADVIGDRLEDARAAHVRGLQRARARRLERMRTRMPLPRDRFR